MLINELRFAKKLYRFVLSFTKLPPEHLFREGLQG